jgi:peptide/nickel transport system permease protein
MLRHVVGRALEAAIVLLAMSFVVYILIGLMPGDPVDLLTSADPDITSADIARLRAYYGLDQPLLGRYGAWLGAVLQGDLGLSRTFARPVTAVLADHLGNTLVLMGASLVLAFLLALPLGILAARSPGGLLDRAINLFAFAGISVPPFWLALLAILLFGVVLGWLPAGGVATVGDGGFVDRLRHALMPVGTLTLLTLAPFVRIVRAALIEALRQDYIRTARAKGCGPLRVVFEHALRNAMLPVVTILALYAGTLISGALVIETMFAYRGMGKLIYDAVLANDYNLALAGLLLATMLTLAANLGADVVYAGLDPRIRYDPR